MPAVTRIGDNCTGHGCFPPRPSIAGSGNVFVNGIAVHRQADGWNGHGCAVCLPHGGSLEVGSTEVFVNALGMGRVGDGISCGSRVAAGSGNVFAGP